MEDIGNLLDYHGYQYEDNLHSKVILPETFFSENLEKFTQMDWRYLYEIFRNTISQNKLECFISNKMLKPLIKNDAYIKACRKKFVDLGLIKLKKIRGGWIHKINMEAIADDNSMKEARELLDSAEKNLQKENYDGAINNIKKIVKEKYEITNSQKVQAHFILGNAYHKKYEYEDALEQYRRALDLAIDYKEKTYQGVINITIGKLYLDKINYRKALEYCQRGLTLAKDLEHYHEECRALNCIGLICQYKGDIGKAYRYFQQSLIVAKSNELKKELIDSSIFIASCLNEYMGNHSDAQRQLQNALTIVEETDDNYRKAILMCKFAELHIIHKDYDKAIDVAKEAEEISKENSFTFFHAFSLFLQGVALYKDNNQEEAGELFQDSKEILNDTSYEALRCEVDIYIGAIEMREDFEKGRETILSALKIADNRNFMKAQISGNKYLGKITCEHKKSKKGLEHLNNALKLAELANLMNEITDISFSISDCSSLV